MTKRERGKPLATYRKVLQTLTETTKAIADVWLSGVSKSTIFAVRHSSDTRYLLFFVGESPANRNLDVFPILINQIDRVLYIPAFEGNLPTKG